MAMGRDAMAARRCPGSGNIGVRLNYGDSYNTARGELDNEAMER